VWTCGSSAPTKSEVEQQAMVEGLTLAQGGGRARDVKKRTSSDPPLRDRETRQSRGRPSRLADEHTTDYPSPNAAPTYTHPSRRKPIGMYALKSASSPSPPPLQQDGAHQSARAAAGYNMRLAISRVLGHIALMLSVAEMSVAEMFSSQRLKDPKTARRSDCIGTAAR
jgi:hypothetical protein